MKIVIWISFISLLLLLEMIIYVKTLVITLVQGVDKKDTINTFNHFFSFWKTDELMK